jgi:3-hydroxy acid dehydrogenase/malonic semialdehyde reductase
LETTVLVTGASSGIGESICRTLLEHDYRVVGAARNIDKLNQLAKQLGQGFSPLILDVTDGASVDSLVSRSPEAFRDIDVLINNAGHDIGGRQSFELASAELWCDIIETNVQGMIRVTRALIDIMLERGHGHIVNMGSIAGLKAFATMGVYVASKHAVHGLSETLRLDYAGKGIRVTEIMPGLVRTNFASQRLGDEQKADEFYDSSGPCLAPEDIARTVVFALQQPAHVEIAQLVVLPVS